jgi:GNAT superfamily N-acetyltransferase
MAALPTQPPAAAAHPPGLSAAAPQLAPPDSAEASGIAGHASAEASQIAARAATDATPVRHLRAAGLADLGFADLDVRDLGPGDDELVDRLYAGLGPQSRYQRFHGPKPRLTAADLAFLTGTDGRDHVALVAMDASGAPIGVARFVRIAGDPRTADIAAEVIDACQNRGIGMELLGRLARRAAALGVQRFSATVLSQSRLRSGLVRRGWKVREFDGPTTTLDVDVWQLAKAAAA